MMMSLRVPHEVLSRMLVVRIVILTAVYDNLSIVTRSHPSAFPSVLRQKRQLVSHVSRTDENTMEQATIKEKCPGCGNEEMNFHTLQLRSADEGTTVFYDCPKCGYKFSQNN